MSFNPDWTDGCPAPFYNAAQFPDTGAIAARVCIPAADMGNLTCCLPCPTTQWIYSDQLKDVSDGAAIINIVSFAALAFILLSYAVLPVKFTRQHYLNTSLIVSIMLINLGFIVPYADKTDSCANPITPNDMETSTACAFSGAFILSGALAAVTWVLVRAASMHLQICWSTNPGRKFYWLTQIGGWLVPGAVFIAAMAATGVSFRFGPNVCHINHANSMATFWPWLVALAGITVIIQTATMAFCLKVYLGNIGSGDAPTTNDSAVSAATSTGRAPTARTIYRRLKRVLWLQWRGLVIVTVMLIDVIFFVIVFIYLDRSSEYNKTNIAHATPWVTCLLNHAKDPQQCFELGQDFLVTQGTINAVLIMLSVIGIISFLLMARTSFITGWKERIFGVPVPVVTAGQAPARSLHSVDQSLEDEKEGGKYRLEIRELDNESQRESYISWRDSNPIDLPTLALSLPSDHAPRHQPAGSSSQGSHSIDLNRTASRNSHWAEFAVSSPYEGEDETGYFYQ